MRQCEITILVIVTLFAVVQSATALQVYFNDFEGAVGPEWSHTTTDTTPLGGRGFLGQFGNDTVSLTLNDLPEFTDISVSFELFIIRTWDGNGGTGFSPDIWNLSVSAGPTLLHTTFSNISSFNQAYPGTYPGGSFPWRTDATETNTLGYEHGGIRDAVYQLNFNSPHSDNSLTLNFTGTGLQILTDESWGLDNIQVAVTAIPEPASIILVGAAIAGLAALARKRMRKVKSMCGISLLLVTSIFLFAVSHANALLVPHLEWIRTYDSPNHSVDIGHGVALDLAGNVYVTGKENRSDLGQGWNVWLRKYDTDGNTLWTETYDSPAHDNDEGLGVAVDTAGNVYVTGYEKRGDLVQDHNIWLRKYDTDGNTLWTETHDSPYHWRDEGRGVAVDSAGNVYVTGREHRGDLGQSDNVWLRKYDTNGNTLWTETYDNPLHEWDLGTAVAVDSGSNVYVTGIGHYKIWLRKYDADGNEIWTQTNIPSGSWEQGTGVTTDVVGNVYVIGHELHPSSMWEPYDIWVRKYDPNGNTLWTDTYDSPYHGRDLGYAVVVDPAGNVYVTGHERRDDLGQSDNIWLRKYDTYGNILWTETYDSPTHGADLGYGLALDIAGNIYLAGQSDDDIILLKYSQIPEPASIILIGAALAGLAGFARKRLNMKSN